MTLKEQPVGTMLLIHSTPLLKVDQGFWKPIGTKNYTFSDKEVESALERMVARGEFFSFL